MIEWKKIAKLCEGLEFPEEAVFCLGNCYKIIEKERFATDLFEEATELLFHAEEAEDKMYSVVLQKISENTNIRIETVEMAFFLSCAIPLREEYERRGLSETVYWETIRDLKAKLIECKNIYGIWGTFVGRWFRRFYLCERFAFGRLQFEKAEFPYDEYKGIVKRGDNVYFCHIPSDGGALTEESVTDSLSKAYAFYKKELSSGLMPVVCHSWLLYEPFEEVFHDSKNITAFRKMFDVLENKTDEKNSDFWRVFNTFYTQGILEKIKPKTRLQANLKEWLQSGKTMGTGYGILLFDGEKILN